MQIVTQSVFLAFDGTPFLTEKDCTAYEDGHWHKQLVGMTLEQVIAAMDRKDVDRANAIERAARKIAKLRALKEQLALNDAIVRGGDERGDA